MKKILTAIWNEFVYGGHVLAIGAVSIIFTSSILLTIKITWDFLIIVYLGVYLVYLYNRYKELEQDFLTNPQSVQYLKNHIKYAPLIILTSIFLIISIQIFLNKRESLFISIFMILLGIFYSIYFKKITKRVVGFKSFFVPFIWASLIFFLVIYYSINFNLGLFLIFIFIYLRVFIGVSFSDIKDIESDKKESLKTFPIILGKKNTLLFLSIFNVLALIPIIIGVFLKIFPTFSLIMFLTSVYTFYYIKKSRIPDANISVLTRKLTYNENPLWSIFILIGILLDKIL